MKKAHCLALTGALLTITSTLLAQSTPTAILSKENPSVYNYVEQMPSFRGGPDSLLAYIRNNTRYPVEALYKGVVGKVFVSFVVNAQGKVKQACILKGVHPALDLEALRVISNMPAAWQPGKHEGKSVAVSFTVPVTFYTPEARQLLNIRVPKKP
ncbi:energy transducer TonB [Hymenobacter cavernae]|uniref:TonB C-terminal domain-containing protein n=1 Tax=Hymenobacter cavernae TaxID=2044852 RepID=A0ABQ1TLD3_9BACT|nr:energy transducer TonB [Hymenobacter cavernae]GGE98405.1 hypothetical protein GCM10011383_06530 [Hymenobacter cavernae]